MIFAYTIGLRSKQVIIFLSGRGYNKIANMEGGIFDWERYRLTITTDINSRLPGSCIW